MNFSIEFLKSLEPGEHTFTLKIFDDEGHETNDTVQVTVSDTFVMREGPTQIQLGQKDKTI